MALFLSFPTYAGSARHMYSIFSSIKPSALRLYDKIINTSVKVLTSSIKSKAPWLPHFRIIYGFDNWDKTDYYNWIFHLLCGLLKFSAKQVRTDCVERWAIVCLWYCNSIPIQVSGVLVMRKACLHQIDVTHYTTYWNFIK